MKLDSILRTSNGARAITFTGAGLLLLGLCYAVGVCSWRWAGVIASGKSGAPPAAEFVHLGAFVALIFFGICILGVGCYSLPEVSTPEPAHSREMYGRCLVGVGYALLCDGMMNLIALAGFANAGILPGFLGLELGGDPQSVQGGSAVNVPLRNFEFAILLLMCLGMAVLGALFFFANSLWDKMNSSEPYVPSLFWGGLWFRIGEAIIFAVVIFIALDCAGQQKGCVLLLVSLLVGMFLKSGEALIAGLAARVFAAFAQLVPVGIDANGKDEVVACRLMGGSGGTPSNMELASVKDALKKLKGVKEVKGPFGGDELRVLYRSDHISASEVRNQILMSGLSIVPEFAVLQVSPDRGVAPGGIVKILGVGFKPGVRAWFGGVEGEVTVTTVTNTSFDVKVPTHAPGSVEVVVTNPDGRSASAPTAFTY